MTKKTWLKLVQKQLDIVKAEGKLTGIEAFKEAYNRASRIYFNKIKPTKKTRWIPQSEGTNPDHVGQGSPRFKSDFTFEKITGLD